jgi:hypothetical protein
MISDGKVYDPETCENPTYKAMMDGVLKGAVTETPWVDEKPWENGRVLETFISSDAVDVQGDSILQRGLIKVMPWLNKYGYYEWHHTGFPVGHYLGWRMKDGKVQVRVGFHDTAHSNMPAHDKAWKIVREFGAKGRSSIKGAPNAIKKLMNGVRQIDDLGCFAVGWVGDNAANPFAEVTSVSFAKGAALKKEVVQQGDRWAVVSEGAADPIATFATKEEADATLQAIEGNKAMDKGVGRHQCVHCLRMLDGNPEKCPSCGVEQPWNDREKYSNFNGYPIQGKPPVNKERAPDSLHDKIAKELFGKAVGELDATQRAQVTRRAEELLMLQAEELFKERAAGRISLAVYGELLLFKERAALRKAYPASYFKYAPAIERAEFEGIEGVEDEDLTAAGQKAKYEAIAEGEHCTPEEARRMMTGKARTQKADIPASAYDALTEGPRRAAGAAGVCRYHPNTKLDESGECPECMREVLDNAKRHKAGIGKGGRAKLTPEEDRAWEEAFLLYLDEGKTDAQADRAAWKDVQQQFPRLREFSGAEKSRGGMKVKAYRAIAAWMKKGKWSMDDLLEFWTEDEIKNGSLPSMMSEFEDNLPDEMTFDEFERIRGDLRRAVVTRRRELMGKSGIAKGQCINCDGTGSVEFQGQKLECPVCGGSGKGVRCGNCGGTGKVSYQGQSLECPSCEGTGRVDKSGVQKGPLEGVVSDSDGTYAYYADGYKTGGFATRVEAQAAYREYRHTYVRFKEGERKCSRCGQPLKDNETGNVCENCWNAPAKSARLQIMAWLRKEGELPSPSARELIKEWLVKADSTWFQGRKNGDLECPSCGGQVDMVATEAAGKCPECGFPLKGAKVEDHWPAKSGVAKESGTCPACGKVAELGTDRKYPEECASCAAELRAADDARRADRSGEKAGIQKKMGTCSGCGKNTLIRNSDGLCADCYRGWNAGNPDTKAGTPMHNAGAWGNCPDCNGAGSVDGIPCKFCGGEGIAPIDEEKSADDSARLPQGPSSTGKEA